MGWGERWLSPEATSCSSLEAPVAAAAVEGRPVWCPRWRCIQAERTGEKSPAFHLSLAGARWWMALENVVFSGRAGKGPAVGLSRGPGCRETRSWWDFCSPQWPCWSSRASLPRRATRAGCQTPLTLGALLTLQALVAGNGASPPALWELSQVCVWGAVAPFQAVDDLLGF